MDNKTFTFSKQYLKEAKQRTLGMQLLLPVFLLAFPFLSVQMDLRHETDPEAIRFMLTFMGAFALISVIIGFVASFFTLRHLKRMKIRLTPMAIERDSGKT